MERAPKVLIGIVLTILVVIGLIAYIYLQSREFLRGPVITVTSPENGQVATTSLIRVSGTAKNVSFFTLNGKQIFTDEQGRFRELLLLPEGYSIMTLEAKDRFGHTEIKRLELLYKPELSVASSSPPARGGVSVPTDGVVGEEIQSPAY